MKDGAKMVLPLNEDGQATKIKVTNWIFSYVFFPLSLFGALKENTVINLLKINQAKIMKNLIFPKLTPHPNFMVICSFV